MVDKMMLKILSLQEKINDQIKHSSILFESREEFKEAFSEYCEMLKNSVFRVEAVKILRMCSRCKSRHMNSFCRLKCLHLICMACMSSNQYPTNDGNGLAVVCVCTSLSTLDSLEITRSEEYTID